jgi:predicted glycosyltransferase
MTLLTSDLNSFVPLSSNMAEQCSRIASELGYQVPPVKFPFMAGGTDAAEFAKAGIEATTLAAMNWEDKGDAPAYHTTRDTIDAVDPIAVQRSIDLAIHYVRQKDGEISEAIQMT